MQDKITKMRLLQPRGQKSIFWAFVLMVLAGSTILTSLGSHFPSSTERHLPTVLPASPAIEKAPSPTHTAKGEVTVVIENPDAPALPKLTAPLEVTTAGATVRLEALDNHMLSQGRADAQVCFSIPSSSLDWSIGEAWLETTGGKWPVTASALLRYQKAPDGTMWRCELLTFKAPKTPPSEKQPSFTRVIIASLRGPQSEQPDCEAIQKALEGEGIQVAPVQQTGIGGCRVVSKPESMSLEAAQARVAEFLMPQRQGPWVLPLHKP